MDYAARIARVTNFDPALVEAWMRLEHGTLDHLSPAQFDAEARLGAQMVEFSPPADSHRLAQSFGLTPVAA